MQKKLYCLFILIFSLFSLTGCTRTDKIIKNINSYAIYTSELICNFSINSNSSMIAYEKTNDSIYISYENEDYLNLKLITEDTKTFLELEYKSNNSLDKKELSKIISIITGDSLLMEEESKIEEFLKSNGKLTTSIDNGIFEFEKNENILSIKTTISN